MDDKIKVLTDKILNEGVEKGKEQANQLIAEAQKKAQETIEHAKAEAERILSEAQKTAQEQKKNTEAEIGLAVGQSLQSVKSAIADSIADKLSLKAVDDAMKNPDFLRSIVAKIIEKWQPGEQLVVETGDAEGLLGYFQANAKELLDKGVEVRDVAGRQANFAIMPKDGGYKINFGEEELKAFFKSFLRPRLVEQLFS